MVVGIGGLVKVVTPGAGVGVGHKPSPVADSMRQFGDLLGQALQQVEQSQQSAAAASQRLAAGEIKDLSEVMIASEQASLTMQLTVQVRNKVLEAYQEMMRMPV